MAQRLKHVQVDNRDALQVIKSTDREDTFFYIDPPYVGRDQGCYDGYTIDNFKSLVELLQNIKGKFILSHYEIEGFRWPSKWYKRTHDKIATCMFSPRGEKKPQRKELLLMNFEELPLLRFV